VVPLEQLDLLVELVPLVQQAQLVHKAQRVKLDFQGLLALQVLRV
jgi:hypothetical protein